jgi:serine/threonine-protein kinase
MLSPGDKVGQYAIEAEVGRGGMGRVFRAHDERLQRKVAVKVIDAGFSGEEAKARLLREARAAAALDHPNVVSIFDVGEVDQMAYVVMELVSGHTLRDKVGDAGVPVATRLAWLTDVARTLGSAHKRGLVHRDVKPENVMVRDDGVVKVLDFGIARRAGGAVDPHGATESPAFATLTVDGVKLGTPVYMSPEHVRSLPLDGRADQFAWGVVAYELLTGRLPWRGGADALAVVASILTDTPDRAALEGAGVSPAVATAVLRAMAKKPEDRFASMEDLVRALGEAGASTAPAPSPTEALRFDSTDAREVLAQAVELAERPRADGKLGYEDLVAAAGEVGASKDAVRAAAHDLRARREVPVVTEEQSSWIRRKRRRFFRHAGIYLVVNMALFLFFLLVGTQIPTFSVALAWGIGLAIHGLRALTANVDDWQDEQEKRQRHEERRERKRKWAEQWVPPPYRRDALPPVARGAAPTTNAQAATPRVRVARDTGRAVAEAESEELARAEEREGARERRR